MKYTLNVVRKMLRMGEKEAVHSQCVMEKKIHKYTPLTYTFKWQNGKVQVM